MKIKAPPMRLAWETMAPKSVLQIMQILSAYENWLHSGLFQEVI